MTMTTPPTFPEELEITPEDIDSRRKIPEPTQRVIFRVAGLYGVSKESAQFPISKTESIDTGPVSITLDPENSTANLGMIDYDRCYLRIRYGVHAVFPGMHKLVMGGNHDLSLLGPVRAVATDECQVTPEMTGWRALGCLDFLPGSLWAGASGG
jgi:hypothetical protein